MCRCMPYVWRCDFIVENEAKDLIKKAEIWKPEIGKKVKPRVSYLNLPKKFIAGTVYDPVKKEVIIGATCILREDRTNKIYKAKTDNYGDFWFEDLKDGKFELEIKKGEKTKLFRNLDTIEKDINLGDIPL